MEKLEICLETVTPLLLHGAQAPKKPEMKKWEENKETELRAPSLRGVMRYWLRAAAGAVIGDGNLDGLRKMEEAVFGQSEQSASPISVRFLDHSPNKPIQVYILPHKSQGPRKAIPENQPLSVTLSAYRNLERGAWECAISALLLATIFGGLGQRSRRGYGTLRIMGSTNNRLHVSPDTVAGWQQYIDQVITQALANSYTLATALRVATPGAPLRSTAANFPTATTLNMIRLGSRTFKTPQDAVTGLMNGIHSHLTARTGSHRYLGGASPRQASPLWARVIQTGPGQYQLLLAVLASQFKNNGDDYGQLAGLVNSFPGANLTVKGWNA